jgi:hypothetical protein
LASAVAPDQRPLRYDGFGRIVGRRVEMALDRLRGKSMLGMSSAGRAFTA